VNDLIADLAKRTGLDREAIEKALGLIVSFIEREDRSRQVTTMIDQIDGARTLANSYGGRGGIFILFTELSGAGLGMGEIKAVATGFLDFAKARFGAAPVDQVLRSIPALAQFL
jgi:hypothetical protein